MRSLPVTATSLNRYMQTVRQQSSPVPPAQHRQAREEGQVQYARALWNRNPRFTGEKTLLALYVTRASRAVAWLQRPRPNKQPWTYFLLIVSVVVVAALERYGRKNWTQRLLEDDRLPFRWGANIALLCQTPSYSVSRVA